MWALEPLNNGSASSARRAVRTVAEHGAWKPGVRPSDLSRVESAQWVKVGVSEDTGRQVPAEPGVLAPP